MSNQEGSSGKEEKDTPKTDETAPEAKNEPLTVENVVRYLLDNPPTSEQFAEMARKFAYVPSGRGNRGGRGGGPRGRGGNRGNRRGGGRGGNSSKA